MSVREFCGKHRFLSNFWPAPVIGPGGHLYPTVEHAYQAEKSSDPEHWALCNLAKRPGAAKMLGVALSKGGLVRGRMLTDGGRIDAMHGFLLQKFAIGTELSGLLVATGAEHIYEGNAWGDEFWGVTWRGDMSFGRNEMGVLLMRVREGLR